MVNHKKKQWPAQQVIPGSLHFFVRTCFWGVIACLADTFPFIDYLSYTFIHSALWQKMLACSLKMMIAARQALLYRRSARKGGLSETAPESG